MQSCRSIYLSPFSLAARYFSRQRYGISSMATKRLLVRVVCKEENLFYGLNLVILFSYPLSLLMIQFTHPILVPYTLSLIMIQFSQGGTNVRPGTEIRKHLTQTHSKASFEARPLKTLPKSLTYGSDPFDPHSHLESQLHRFDDTDLVFDAIDISLLQLPSTATNDDSHCILDLC